MKADFVIAGAGINGLLLARELGAANARVVLVEQGQCGKEASWAGGGIISPLYPWRYAPAITALASWAQDFYPELVRQLLSETGIDAELQCTGLLMLDTSEEEEALAWAAAHGRAMQRLSPAEFLQKEAHLSHSFQSALWMPEVANVRNPRLIQALVTSLRQQAGVTILEQTRVKGLHREQDRVTGVDVEHAGGSTRLEAGAVIVSAGSWSGELLAGAGCALPIEPVKGQMLLYKLPTRRLNGIVLVNGKYLIPRKDGHVLAGSTLEYCGFDKRVTDEGRAELMAAAEELLPQLKGLAPVSQWSGLRPGAPQGLPYIGRLPTLQNLYVNAGQFRNGLVLAPASARLLADCLLGRAPIVDPRPYQPEQRTGTG